ncbi:FxDxF family PEP-CTERM protein [Massilia antarctica]|uniref:FxDxF family PEP-CTERM protein n=1 Tax=Massilia antarctica TaxID=2765360 RepID=UPI0006BB7069|nr:FxDxF family PEP-CTERM protein [Massilia sp. H27-R4]MCY0910550.1 FxDxF family PEP-CTERM protein [Massilia sp. H27-R4]
MKHMKSLIAAAVLATASLGSTAAFAADISHSTQALSVIDNSANFGSSFVQNNLNNTFMDKFSFSITRVPHDFDAIVTSFTRNATTGMDITNMSLFSGAGTLITTGLQESTGATDVWSLRADSLGLGNYYLQVSGKMVSGTAGSFGGTVMLAPVPEPETYGMMLAGLGVVGFLARRRKAAKQA